MAYVELNAAQKGAQADVITDYSVETKKTDIVEWTNDKWSQYLGYYKSIPELKMAIDAKATWTIGKGFIAEPQTSLLLGTIIGNGKDTFNSILENNVRVYNIGGDSYNEIIRDGENLVNLKPLDPSTIKHIANEKGLIIRFEQTVKGKTTKFKPEDIFYLSRNRVSDEIHGISIVESVEKIILMRNEAMADYKKLLHRNIYPVRIWHLDTDIPSKITAFKAKVAASKGEGEDIFIPKGAVDTELATVPANSILDPKAWIQLLNQYFYQAVGVPQIIIGGSQELTQTAAQIAYLAFEQTIEEEQLYIEQQVLKQLNIEINLEFPASLQNNLLSGYEKDGTIEERTNQPSNLQPPMMREQQ